MVADPTFNVCFLLLKSVVNFFTKRLDCVIIGQWWSSAVNIAACWLYCHVVFCRLYAAIVYVECTNLLSSAMCVWFYLFSLLNHYDWLDYMISIERKSFHQSFGLEKLQLYLLLWNWYVFTASSWLWTPWKVIYIYIYIPYNNAYNWTYD